MYVHPVVHSSPILWLDATYKKGFVIYQTEAKPSEDNKKHR